MKVGELVKAISQMSADKEIEFRFRDDDQQIIYDMHLEEVADVTRIRVLEDDGTPERTETVRLEFVEKY